MSESYAVIAPIYDQLGMSGFAQTMTPGLLNFAQHNGWMGRRVIDFGCGTGVSLMWFAKHSYIVTGVDNSPDMLARAKASLQQAGASASWLEADIREMPAITPADLVIAIDTLNELDSLRELEAVFQSANRALNTDRMFLFDMYTIEGLTALNASASSIVHDDDTLVAVSTNDYDFDRQILTREFVIFTQDGDVWHQARSRRVMRAYPVQAIASLLKRSGFEVLAVLGENMNRYMPGQPGSQRAIFLAKKQSE